LAPSSRTRAFAAFATTSQFFIIIPFGIGCAAFRFGATASPV
jgi:hypothetical protein